MPESAPTDVEAALGFALQMLGYPEGGYELAGLKTAGGERRERAVALILDEANRLRRRHGDQGYVRETFDGAAWKVAEVFASADEVAASDSYRRYRQSLEAEPGDREDDSDEP